MLTRIITRSCAVAAIFLVAACATSANKPKIVKNFDAAAAAPFQISNVSIETASGVWMSDADRTAMLQKIKSKLDALTTASGQTAATATSYSVKLLFTRYDRGAAAARLALIGLGQIHMEATVSIVDRDGNLSGEYYVGKGLVLGGIAGGLISAKDVEEGLAKSVAAIFAPKKDVAAPK
jgi:hypothetical protein